MQLLLMTKEIIMPFDSAEFNKAWELWKKYKKDNIHLNSSPGRFLFQVVLMVWLDLKTVLKSKVFESGLVVHCKTQIFLLLPS